MFGNFFDRDSSLSVSQITQHISALFDRDETLNDVWIKGEVSNMTAASSGHWYFTLKDQDAQLKCVMWRGAAQRQSFTPKAGDAVEVHGKVQVYIPRGEYQLYADAVRPVGVGDLYQQFERLKHKLEAEGLFDADRKRDTPFFPYQIGVVTSPTAAAFQDVQNVLRRRFPLAKVILSPTLVQGVDAPPQIVRAIQRLNEFNDVDVILLVRGGGSIEDLWAFNDENVARAVSASRIPIITGVGHEIDFTIVDFVSDVRAPTPSAAAEMATPDIDKIRQSLGDQAALLAALMDDRIDGLRRNLDQLARALNYHSPEVTVRNARQRIDDLTGRLLRHQRGQIDLLRERVESRRRALEAADPKAILARGYAIITHTQSGKRIVSQLDAQPGDAITIQLRDGELKARIEDENQHEHYQRRLF